MHQKQAEEAKMNQEAALNLEIEVVVVVDILLEDDAWDQDHRGCQQKENEDSSLKEGNPHEVFS